ncbi:MAG: ATP-binding protein, partial [Planctomycetota bacterium]
SRMMRFAGREKGLELVVEKPPQRLPMLLGDARRLEQILLNLIGNAIKWTESGSVTAGCQPIAIAADEARVEFWVSDTGIGIDPSDQQRVFEPFTQLPGASRPSRGGAGLGLSICRRIADAMNARLRLESSPGAGTTVTLAGVFPVAPPEWSAANEHAPSVLPDPIDVLVVEDTEVNQLLIRRLLQREGHRVEVVGSGEEAVATYGEARFDMVLVDLQLPGIDGATTVNRLNEIDTGLNRPSPPMVCITAHTGPAAAVAEREFDAVVTKPLKREPLIRTLARVLNRSDDDPNRGEPTQCQETTEAPTPRNNIDCELAIAFLGIAEEQLDRLGDALQQRETTEARVLAHRFRGQLAYFDFDPVIEKLARLEDFLETHDAESAQTIRENVLAD